MCIYLCTSSLGFKIFPIFSVKQLFLLAKNLDIILDVRKMISTKNLKNGKHVLFRALEY